MVSTLHIQNISDDTMRRVNINKNSKQQSNSEHMRERILRESNRNKHIVEHDKIRESQSKSAARDTEPREKEFKQKF